MMLVSALLLAASLASQTPPDGAVWFYLAGDDAAGPMTLAELREAVDAMIVVDDTPVWTSDDIDPELASSVRELADLFPPPLPIPNDAKRPRISDGDGDAPAVTRTPAAPTSSTDSPPLALGLVAGGAALGVIGVVFDVASPSSANERVDALDFVGPTAIVVGVGLLIGGAVVAASSGG